MCGAGSRLAERDLARKWTLARVAEDRLDEMHNLAVGKPAPEIDGVDLDGKPMKLSDYRGKVVVLVFWGSWCGPCMEEVPHERELVERLEDKPFALLGVDCEEDKQAARAVMERERMTWPSWYDGTRGEGPIAQRYQIRGYPSTFVLDAKGIIREGKVGAGLDQAVDELLGELHRAPFSWMARHLNGDSGEEATDETLLPRSPTTDRRYGSTRRRDHPPDR